MEITNLEHEFEDDRFVPRVNTRFCVDGMKHFYTTFKGDTHPQMVQWWTPEDVIAADAMSHQYYSKCPAHIRAVVEEQVPIVAIMLS